MPFRTWHIICNTHYLIPQTQGNYQIIYDIYKSDSKQEKKSAHVVNFLYVGDTLDADS